MVDLRAGERAGTGAEAPGQQDGAVREQSIWAAGNGSWSISDNWTGLVPNAVGAGAVINAPVICQETVSAFGS